MKIPNAHKAIVDIRKLADYCLNYAHPRGKHKARVFQSALDITAEQSAEVRNLLLEKVQSEDAVIGLIDDYGTRYILDFLYVRGRKQAMLRSTWIVKVDEDIPRLTSCFVL